MRLIDKISELMVIPRNVRNIGLVAHIDHGKTTLSDSLLVSAGVLAPSTAGEARALDFLPEEQRRGITMKTANISLPIKRTGEYYLINLIDSPGHVDFSGKVARALRIIDGAIVVIDAVEQVMAQTETVIRQCVSEAVKPILFINKVDRLINELKLSPKQIAERLEIIYNNFNSLVAKFSRNVKVPQWECTPQDGSVVFGSALHRWAISVPVVKETKITFDKIFKHYKNGDYKALQELLPIDKPLIDMIINHLPDPISAQNYRIKNLWQGDLSSEVGSAMTECRSTNGKTPLIFGSTKTLMDQHAGPLILGRVFAGTLKEKTTVRLLNLNSIRKVQNVYIFMGADKRKITEVPAGNIAAISGLGEVNPGETIIEETVKDVPPFEEIKYLATPVVTIAIEPKMLRDLPLLKRILERYDLEDPNLIITIDEKSGELLLSGLGELHLETIVNDISMEVECTSSPPLVVIVERIEKASMEITRELFGTKVKIKVEPFGMNGGTGQISSNNNIINSSKEQQIGGKIIRLRQYNNEIIILNELLSKLADESLDNILMGVKEALASGPISSKPVSGVRVTIVDFRAESGEKFEHTVPLLRNAVWDALREGGVTPQEPIYKIQVTVPVAYLGRVTSVINKRRGNIADIRSDQDLLIISGTLPVAESFNIDRDLRSETEGRAFWQMAFEKYEPTAPSNLNGK